MGCRVVLEAARLLPKRVAGVVLVDGSRQGGGDPDAAEAARSQLDQERLPRVRRQRFSARCFSEKQKNREAIVARAVRTSASFGPELWPRMARWDAAQVESALAAVRGRILAIQSTTRNAQLQRSPMKPGETSPWLDLVKSYGARVEIVPDTGHFTQLEAPRARQPR